MKYEYKGILVESGTQPDSAMFHPVGTMPMEEETKMEHKPAGTQEKRTKTAAGRRKQP